MATLRRPDGAWLAVAIALSVLVITSAIALAAAPAVVDYPLALHTRWIYHLRQDLQPGVHFGESSGGSPSQKAMDATVVSEVVGFDVISGTQYARVESRRSGKLWLTEWLRALPDALLLGKTLDSDQGQETIMQPPQKLLSATLRPGESWVWEAQDAPVTIHTKILNPAKVSVPAGTFTATEISLDITIQTADMPAPVQGQQKRWFVPGIGFVKQDTQFVTSGRILSHIVLDLEKFERGPVATNMDVSSRRLLSGLGRHGSCNELGLNCTIMKSGEKVRVVEVLR